MRFSYLFLDWKGDTDLVPPRPLTPPPHLQSLYPIPRDRSYKNQVFKKCIGFESKTANTGLAVLLWLLNNIFVGLERTSFQNITIVFLQQLVPLYPKWDELGLQIQFKLTYKRVQNNHFNEPKQCSFKPSICFIFVTARHRMAFVPHQTTPQQQVLWQKGIYPFLRIECFI